MDQRDWYLFPSGNYNCFEDSKWGWGNRDVEAGAQGAHKLARGYRPTHTYSAHWIAHQGLRDAVDDFLQQERDHVLMDIEYLDEHSPFRKS